MDEAALVMLSRWEKRVIAALCLIAAVRVFVFCGAFPFFNNVDEHAHVDLVLKFARGHWPNKPVEHYDAAAARLFALYGTFEYLYTPEQFPGGIVPRPLWDTPAIADRVVNQQVALWTRARNHEANSPPVYYAIAGLWYQVGDWLRLTDGQRLYWIRFLNVPLFALLLFCAHVFCRTLYPERVELRLGVPMLLAFLPQDVFYSVNSDVLSPILFTVSLMLLLNWHRRSRTGAGFNPALGFLIALTFLVKYTNIALPLVFGVVVLLKAHRLWHSHRKDAVWSGSIAVLSAAIPIAFCIGRNYLLLGDLAGTRAKVELLGWSHRPFNGFLAHPIFSPSGVWHFWSGLMKTFWRGEFVWHSKQIADPIVDDFYVVSSSVLLLSAAVASWKRGRPPAVSSQVGTEGPGAVVHMAVWGSVVVSVLCLVCLSVWFEYGGSFYPSQKRPYFLAGRLIAGALIPFLILYIDGVAVLLKRVSPVVGPLFFVALTSVIMTISEFTLTKPVFPNPYNWFHLP